MVAALAVATIVLLAGCGESAGESSGRSEEAAGEREAAAAGSIDHRPAAARRWAVGRFASRLSDEALVGQLFMVGVEFAADGRPLADLDDHARMIIREVQPGGIVLFGHNFQSVPQVTTLVAELHGLTFIPPLIATDQEGGAVARLAASGGIPATPIPSAATVAKAVAVSPSRLPLVRELGRVMGRELRALGVTMNFAPVADIDPPGGRGPIGVDGRTFGRDPDRVGDIVAALAAGMQDAGVVAVVKHYPGHGGADADTHDGVVVLERTVEELLDRELVPFRLAFDGGARAVMTAHLAVRDEPGKLVPVTLSEPMVTGLLRGRLGFDGLVVTDALNMRALRPFGPEPELAVGAVRAGADILLKPVDPVRARDGVLQALRDGTITRARIEESVVRILLEKLRLGLLGPRSNPAATDADLILGRDEHREVVRRLIDGGA